jgi:hypothetical protein
MLKAIGRLIWALNLSDICVAIVVMVKEALKRWLILLLFLLELFGWCRGGSGMC